MLPRKVSLLAAILTLSLLGRNARAEFEPQKLDSKISRNTFHELLESLERDTQGFWKVETRSSGNAGFTPSIPVTNGAEMLLIIKGLLADRFLTQAFKGGDSPQNPQQQLDSILSCLQTSAAGEGQCSLKVAESNRMCSFATTVSFSVQVSEKENGLQQVQLNSQKPVVYVGHGMCF
jgi:hypothetical protein